MKYISLLLFLTGCIARDNIESEAANAAIDYCNCVKESVFRFHTKAELYIHCNGQLGDKYRLLKLYQQYSQSDTILFSDIPKNERDSIDKFMLVFTPLIDSCAYLPK